MGCTLHCSCLNLISIEITNHFSVSSPDENPSDLMGKNSSLEGAFERSIQTDDSNSNHGTPSYKKTNNKKPPPPPPKKKKNAQ